MVLFKEQSYPIGLLYSMQYDIIQLQFHRSYINSIIWFVEGKSIPVKTSPILIGKNLDVLTHPWADEFPYATQKWSNISIY